MTSSTSSHQTQTGFPPPSPLGKLMAGGVGRGWWKVLESSGLFSLPSIITFTLMENACKVIKGRKLIQDVNFSSDLKLHEKPSSF